MIWQLRLADCGEGLPQRRKETGFMENRKDRKTEYRELTETEIEKPLFSGFCRRQEVTRCWRKIGEKWEIRPIAFVDDWTPEEYDELVRCLKNTVRTGGRVFGAFLNGELKGFASLEPERFGSRNQYMDLSSIHVSEEARGRGIGKGLFLRIKAAARAAGAEKLYISAHSAVESQAFYRAMGCVEAEEYEKRHVEKEPCDCQLECALGEEESQTGGEGRFSFREIRPEEAGQAVHIEKVCFPPNEACSESMMRERIAVAPELFLVAVDRETGKIAGFLNGLATKETVFRDEFFTDASLQDPEGKNVMLLGLDVLPEYRGRGLARRIVDEYRKRERKRGRKMLILTCLEEKVGMYEKMGFQNRGLAHSAWGGEQWYEMSCRIQEAAVIEPEQSFDRA